jgi:RNA polymerase sigma-70 factor, ECF subfamily
VTESPDQTRFELVYRDNFRPVLRYALARVDPERAKDVVAETFLVAWRRLPELPDEARPWLFGVARRVIAGEFRSDTRRAALGARLQVVQERPEAQRGLDEDLAERDLVLRAFARLSENDREVLRLVTWDDLTPREAADAVSCGRATFTVRLHRARRRFAAALAEASDPASSRSSSRQEVPLSQNSYEDEGARLNARN